MRSALFMAHSGWISVAFWRARSWTIALENVSLLTFGMGEVHVLETEYLSCLAQMPDTDS